MGIGGGRRPDPKNARFTIFRRDEGIRGAV
jgi:hypothetical protein